MRERHTHTQAGGRKGVYADMDIRTKKEEENVACDVNNNYVIRVALNERKFPHVNSPQQRDGGPLSTSETSLRWALRGW